MNDEPIYTISESEFTSIVLPVKDVGIYSINWENMPMDIICNGFSIKDTILEAIQQWTGIYEGEGQELMHAELAQEITDALAEKLHLKQG